MWLVEQPIRGIPMDRRAHDRTCKPRSSPGAEESVGRGSGQGAWLLALRVVGCGHGTCQESRTLRMPMWTATPGEASRGSIDEQTKQLNGRRHQLSPLMPRAAGPADVSRWLGTASELPLVLAKSRIANRSIGRWPEPASCATYPRNLAATPPLDRQSRLHYSSLCLRLHLVEL